MDKDRIKGSAQQAKGAIKQVAGKVTGDAKLQTEGKSDRAAGKVRNAIGIGNLASSAGDSASITPRLSGWHQDTHQ